ncbi:polysulfide reductase NrfD [bacterium]|nr:polysulfide reductase NrfD [bacterium]
MFGQSAWGWLPSLYLLLGGFAGGIALVSAAVRLACGGMRAEVDGSCALGSFPAVVSRLSLVLLLIGLTCLLLDVDNPDRALVLWDSFSNRNSWMAIGAWVLAVGCVVFAINLIFAVPKLRDALGEMLPQGGRGMMVVGNVVILISGIIGLVIATYTGVLLFAAESIPMWRTLTLPMLFLLSSCSMGVEVSMAILSFGTAFEGLRIASAHTLMTEIAVAGVLLGLGESGAMIMYVIGRSGAGTFCAQEIAKMLTGTLAPWFWGGAVVLGILVPFVCEMVLMTALRRDAHRAMSLRNALGRAQSGTMIVRSLFEGVLPMIAAVSSVVGSFALRCVVIAVGVHEPVAIARLVTASLGIS